MNPDALKLASLQLESNRLKEEARHNVEQEKAALKTAKAKVGDTAAKAAGVIGTLIGKNDPNWEVPSDEILRKPGAIAWDVIRGKQRSLGETSPLIVADPVIGVFDFHFMTGLSTHGYDFDLAMSNLFTILVGTNQSSVNWTKADLAQYIFCTATMYALVNTLERNVAVLDRPQAYLAASPVALLSALLGGGSDGADTAEIYQKNIADIKSSLARLKKFLAINLPLPKGLNVVNRWLWLTKWIFMDEVNEKPRLMAFNPKEYHIPNTSEVHYITSLYKLDDDADPLELISTILDHASRVMNEAAFKSVTAYLFKAAYEKKTIELLPFAADIDNTGCYDPFTYDDELLMQVSNMKICPAFAQTILDQLSLKYSGDGTARIGQGLYNSLAQVTGELFVITNTVNGTYIVQDPNLVGYEDEPLDEVSTFVATRFMYKGKDQTSADFTYYYYDPSTHELSSSTFDVSSGSVRATLSTYGTELITSWKIYSVSENISHNFLIRSYTIDRPCFDGLTESYVLPGISMIQRFDHIPQMIAPDVDFEFYFPLFNCDWITEISAKQINNIERNALTQLWGYSMSVKPSGTAASGGSNSSGGRNKHRNKNRGNKPTKDQGGKGSNPDTKSNASKNDKPAPAGESEKK